MISQETYNYMLYRMSSTEMDVCLDFSTNYDWDNTIHINPKSMAARINTTSKYLREIIATFKSRKKGVPVLVPGTVPGTYKFNIAVSTLDYNERTVKYCKNFNFFYTESFRSLSLNARRLILLSAFEMSTKGTTLVSFFERTLIRRKVGEGLFPMKRKELLKTVQEINIKMATYVQVSLKQSQYTDKPEVEFAYAPEVIQDFRHNHTERDQLKKKLYDAGARADRLFSDEYCIAIEKVAMHLFKSLINREQEIAQVNSKDMERAEQVRLYARRIYDMSIEKFASTYHNTKEELQHPDQVAAYLSAIVHQVMLEEMIQVEFQHQSYLGLYDFHAVRIAKAYNHESNKPFEDKVKVYEQLSLILRFVAENWISVRVNKVTEDMAEIAKDGKKKVEVMQRRKWASVKDAKAHLNSLYEKEMNLFEELKHTIKFRINSHVQNKVETWVIDYYKKVEALFRPYQTRY